jgi:hypothetical protein
MSAHWVKDGSFSFLTNTFSVSSVQVPEALQIGGLQLGSDQLTGSWHSYRKVFLPKKSIMAINRIIRVMKKAIMNFIS